MSDHNSFVETTDSLLDEETERKEIHSHSLPQSDVLEETPTPIDSSPVLEDMDHEIEKGINVVVDAIQEMYDRGCNIF